MPLLSVAAAWERIAALAAPLEAETVPLAAAVDRIAAADARSVVDLPPFDRSAMDGYAVRAAETAAPLALTGALAAGDAAEAALPAGAAVGITTGAALPPGADAVLELEGAEVAGGHVRAVQPVAAGRHVRYRGEDVHAGDVLVRAGERVTLPRLSSLASAGVGEVRVHRRARVHVLATGSELLPLGAPPEPGKIHESNRLMVGLLAARAGAEVLDGGVVPDSLAETRAAVAAGLGADVLVISGGVSVGPHDHVKPALEACGVEEVFWRVRLKPGKPLWFGRRGRTLVLGLPGNPLSSIVCALVFVLPALRALQGDPDPRPAYEPGRLGAPAQAADGRTTYLTARFERDGDGLATAYPSERQGSHLTGALGESDGFVVAPYDAGHMPAGTRVELLTL